MEANVVNLGYVINVIEDPTERATALRDAWNLAKDALIVAARPNFEDAKGGAPFGDGVLTGRRTFQKFYHQHELRNWVDGILAATPSISAGPGVLYVFRDPQRRQAFIASRYRRTSVSPIKRKGDLLFDQHRVLFERLVNFLTSRGRVPDDSEVDFIPDLRAVAGSLTRAVRIVERVTGRAEWEKIRQERAQDLLVFLALARIEGRGPLGSLPRELQLDIRAFFSTYARACAEADRLLFSAGNLGTIDQACESAPIGKLTPSALYIHTSALAALPPVLRVYEGCARSYVGAVEGANVIKLHRLKPQVSYLGYPRFERDPHPALAASFTVPLNSLHVEYRDYTTRVNPPILHRKEEFVPTNHVLRERFARLTRQEERAALYEDPARIGTRQGWQDVLDARNFYLRGHRLLRRRSE
jgi:DNA phosphorothioation-associated putative methyltransferase